MLDVFHKVKVEVIGMVLRIMEDLTGTMPEMACNLVIKVDLVLKMEILLEMVMVAEVTSTMAMGKMARIQT